MQTNSENENSLDSLESLVSFAGSISRSVIRYQLSVIRPIILLFNYSIPSSSS